MNPYIGITDFTAFWQVLSMLEVFSAHLPRGSKRKLHVGVMMSYKTLHHLPNKWRDVFPSNEMIASIFASSQVYNCLHYADYETRPDLAKSLAAAIKYGGERIHALQLDMIWPDSAAIVKGVRESNKNIEVILQIGKNAFDAIGDDPQALVEKLRQYDGVIHRVLLDRSMGRGVGMDAAVLMPCARVLKEHFPDIGLGVAGGLGPVTMNLVEPFVREFPDMSIDAQGKLRQSGSALDPIDWDMAGRYLIEALRLFS